MFLQKIYSTRQNFGAPNRKKCLGGIWGLAIQEAFNERLLSGRSCSRFSCAASVLAFSRFVVAAKMAACTASANLRLQFC